LKLNNVILDGFRSMKDGSLKVTLITRELAPSEMAEIMLSLNQEIVEIEMPDEAKGGKSQSQRLRGVIFRLWEQDYQGKYKDFNIFYDSYMDKMIENIKDKLN